MIHEDGWTVLEIRSLWQVPSPVQELIGDSNTTAFLLVMTMFPRLQWCAIKRC